MQTRGPGATSTSLGWSWSPGALCCTLQRCRPAPQALWLYRAQRDGSRGQGGFLGGRAPSISSWASEAQGLLCEGGCKETRSYLTSQALRSHLGLEQHGRSWDTLLGRQGHEARAVGHGEQSRAINTHFPFMLWHNFQSQSRRDLLANVAWVCPFHALLSPGPQNRCGHPPLSLQRHHDMLLEHHLHLPLGGGSGEGSCLHPCPLPGCINPLLSIFSAWVI